MVDHTVEATIAAKRLGERLGVTTEAIQGLGYAASLSGVSTGVLQSALQRLSFNLQSVGHQSKSVSAAFAKLGLSQADLKKESVDQNLEEIANKFKGMADGAEKNALAMQIFGRTAGPQMVPFLNQGQAGIVALREEAVQLGVTMGEDGVKKAEEFERAQKQLQARFGAIKDDIVMALIPSLNFLMQTLSSIMAWFRQNEPVMIGTIAAIGAAIVYAGHAAVLAWAPILIPFLAFVAAIGIVVGLVYKLQEYLSGVSKIILGVALLFMIFFAPLTAIAALITLIAANWTEVKEAAISVWGAIVDAASAVRDAFEPPIKWLISKIEWVIEKLGAVKHAIGGAISWVADKVGLGGGGGPAGASIPGMVPVYSGAGSGSEGSSPDNGERTAPTLTIHAPITIHAGSANADAVHEMVKTHMENTIRQAHQDVRRGG